VLQTYPTYESFELPLAGSPPRGSISAVPQISFEEGDLRGFVGGQTTTFGLVFSGFLLLDTPPPSTPANKLTQYQFWLRAGGAGAVLYVDGQIVIDNRYQVQLLSCCMCWNVCRVGM
jgi:hypothetical protein